MGANKLCRKVFMAASKIGGRSCLNILCLNCVINWCMINLFKYFNSIRVFWSNNIMFVWPSYLSITISKPPEKFWKNFKSSSVLEWVGFFSLSTNLIFFLLWRYLSDPSQFSHTVKLGYNDHSDNKVTAITKI